MNGTVCCNANHPISEMLSWNIGCKRQIAFKIPLMVRSKTETPNDMLFKSRMTASMRSRDMLVDAIEQYVSSNNVPMGISSSRIIIKFMKQRSLCGPALV